MGRKSTHLCTRSHCCIGGTGADLQVATTSANRARERDVEEKKLATETSRGAWQTLVANISIENSEN